MTRHPVPATASAGVGVRPRSGPPSAFARRVLDVVERIPAGPVMTYGDVAEYLGTRSPRAVGQVMGQWGSEVPWHRVVLVHRGARAAAHPGGARAAPRRGLPLRGDRVDLARARWDGR